MGYFALLVLVAVSVVECRNYHSTHVRCEKPVDLAFVIDISSSIWYKHFRREISFIHDIVNLLDVGDRPTQSRVAAVSFSNRLKPEFGLGQYSTKEGVLNAINNIAYEGGDATRTYLGLEYVHNTIFAPGNGERSNVANVVVVLTDGVTNPGSYDNFTRTEAKQKTQIHAQNIRDIVRAQIYAIGIGNEVDKNEIKGIANKPSEQFTLFVDTFTELDTDAVKKAVLTKVCDSLPQREQECSTSKADIFFVVDESSSLMWDANFRKELKFVGSVIDQFELGKDLVRVGMMTFGTNPRMLFYLNDFKTKTEIESLLKITPWHGGNTYLDKAIESLMTYGLNPGFGSRSDVPQIAVIITDGKSTHPTETEKQIAIMKRMNYVVFAIGVGPNKDPIELHKIASHPSNVFEVDNLDGLVAIRQQLLSQLCPGDQPKPPPVNNCQNSMADLIFVADSSTSIGLTAYNEFKTFAKSVVEKFTVGPKNIQIGLITFSNDAHYEFSLNEYRTKEEVTKAIERVPYSTGNTNTHKALEILIKQGFSYINGGRGTSVPRFAVIITDGSSRQPEMTKQLARKAKDQGIILFSIGVGPYITQTELDGMASSPTSMYSFKVDNYAALTRIEQSLVKRTCEEATRQRQFS